MENKKKPHTEALKQNIIFEECVVMGNNDEQKVIVRVEFENVKSNSLHAGWDFAYRIFKGLADDKMPQP